MSACGKQQGCGCRRGGRRYLWVALTAVILVGGVMACTRPPIATGSAEAAEAATATPTVAPIYLGAAGAPTATPLPVTHAAITAQDGLVRVPSAPLADGVARFYAYQGEGLTIPFFVLKSSDGELRAAFDACDACYPAKKGYHQEGDELVCNNCGSRFPSVKINVETGGCNPIPLAFSLEEDAIIIKAADLAAGARYF